MNQLTRTSSIALVVAALCLLVLMQPAFAQQEQWTFLGLGDLNCCAVAPGNSNLIVAGGANLYVSTDGGSTWNTKSTAGSVQWIAFGSNQNVAYAATWGGGIYKSTDGCATWAQANAGLPNNVVLKILVDQIDDNIVYAGTGSGLCISEDGGANWLSTGVGGWTTALAVVPGDQKIFYVGGSGGAIDKYYDSGAMGFQPMPVTSPATTDCNTLIQDPVDPNIIYGVFRFHGGWTSFDAGQTWKQIQSPFEGFVMAVDKLRAGFVYGVGGWTTPKRSGCYGGTNWCDMATGYNGAFSKAMAVDPNNSSKIYCCTSSGLMRWIADVQAPNAPSGLTASASGSGVVLRWTASSSGDCAGYWVYRRTASGAYSPTPYAAVPGGGTITYTDVDAAGGTTYYYKIAAMDNAQNHSAYSNEVSATVQANVDLDVTYIARLPRDCYRYKLDYNRVQGVPLLQYGSENDKRWPAYGEKVTFEAHFKNKGNTNPGSISYRFRVNGVVISTGTTPGIGQGQEGTASVDWYWNINGIDTDHSDQTVTFEIDYDNRIAETYESNNTLTDFLEGCSLFISVEQPIYDAFNARQNLSGTYSFEDWIQRQIKSMNDNFARSTYPLAPNGCLERVRIDKITVGPTPADDFLCDGRWQFTGDPAYATNAAMSVDGGLIHELMHQLGIIDLYNYPVLADINAVITPDGITNGTTWSWARDGIMAGGDITPHTHGASQTMPEYCSQHDVMGLNKNCGRKRGYYGEYMFDIPTNNYIIVKDAAGNVAPNVDIKVYQALFGSLRADAVITGKTDANGRFLLTNRPVGQIITTDTGHNEHPNPFGTVNVVGGESVLLIEMSRPGGDFDYAWMDLTMFNLAYWGGNTNEWTYTINTHLGTSTTLPRITQLNGTVQGTSVTLSWPAVPGAASYKVYKASPYLNQPSWTDHPYENWIYRQVWNGTATSWPDPSKTETCRYAVTAVDATGKETPLSNRFFAPTLINPMAVILKPDNKRIILDPQNGYAFLLQGADGVYTGNTGSVHNHVEYSRFMAVDNRLGRLLISHPSDQYGGPQSIRITDMNASVNGLRDLGSLGSGPGQFNNPGGVAVDPESRIYAVDINNNRIQIFDANYNFLVAFGSTGVGNNQFNSPQGIAVDASHKIYVCDKGNKRIQILQFNPTNNTVTYVGKLQGKTLTGPTGVAIAPNGDVYITDSSANRVESYTANGNWMRSYTAANGVYTGNLSNPTGIAVDSAGTIIVCDTNNKRVVTITPTFPTTAAAARSQDENSYAQLEGAIVTAKFSGNFYIQEVGRKPGMRVVSAAAVSVGQMVDIYGTVKTVNGEREIQATVAVGGAMATVQPKPHGLTLKTMGGGPFGLVPGITGASGLNNVGLLVKVFGTTSERNTTASTFSLDDGSGFTVKVYAPGLTIPADGSHVIVTGISGAEKPSADTVRVLRARSIDTF